MTTCVVAGISNSKASFIIIGTITGILLSGYLLVHVGGGKQYGTGDSILIGSDYVLLPRGASARR